MNRITIYTLKALRKVYLRVCPSEKRIAIEFDSNPNSVSQSIIDNLESDKPIMIARLGATELSCLCNYKGIQEQDNILSKYIQGNTFEWWWEPKIVKQMQQWSGFFPPTTPALEHFCEIMLSDIPQVDILGSWLSDESFFKDELANSKKIQLLFLDPFWSKVPWTKALEGKNILVVHPFSEAIKNQYSKRELLFANKDVLPKFKSLTLIKAVQSLGQAHDQFRDWFEALDYMKSEIDKVDFDICLIGCGAYGFPLAAYVKRIGKKAIHMGGSLQLLFGIKGKRWENPFFGAIELGAQNMYPQLMNEYWIYPGEETKPKNADQIEGACYW